MLGAFWRCLNTGILLTTPFGYNTIKYRKIKPNDYIYPAEVKFSRSPIWRASVQVNDSVTLGQAIRNRRKELSYTQKYISEVTGFSMSFLSDLENGKPTCEIGKTLHLINLLGLDINVEARG